MNDKLICQLKFTSISSARNYANHLARRNPHWDVKVIGKMIEIRRKPTTDTNDKEMQNAEVQ